MTAVACGPWEREKLCLGGEKELTVERFEIVEACSGCHLACGTVSRLKYGVRGVGFVDEMSKASAEIGRRTDEGRYGGGLNDFHQKGKSGDSSTRKLNASGIKSKVLH